jgi:hypothetical protein
MGLRLARSKARPRHILSFKRRPVRRTFSFLKKSPVSQRNANASGQFIVKGHELFPSLTMGQPEKGLCASITVAAATSDARASSGWIGISKGIFARHLMIASPGPSRPSPAGGAAPWGKVQSGAARCGSRNKHSFDAAGPRRDRISVAESNAQQRKVSFIQTNNKYLSIPCSRI